MSSDALNIPPQNLEAEQMVLGAVILENSALSDADELLRPDDFYKAAHGKIFSAMLAMRERAEAIDLLTLTEMLRHSGVLENLGGASYLSTLVSLVPTAANIRHHARLVAVASQLRAVIRACSLAQGRSFQGEDPDAVISDAVNALNDARRYKTASIATASDLMAAGFSEVERRYDMARTGKIAGIPTGFRDLDRKLFGFIPQLYVLAGAPSMGKSALADHFVRSAAGHFLDDRPDEKRMAGVISLEMGPEQLSLRTISSLSGIPLSRLLAGNMHQSDWQKMADTAGRAASLPICYEFSSFSDREIDRTIDHMVQSLGVRFIEFDYLQLGHVDDHKGTREQEVTKLSRLFKRKIKQHGIPIVVISSLNRGLANRPDKRPTKADLRESGNIEFDADVIMFVYRDEVYNKCVCNKGETCVCGRRGKAEVIIDKGKMEGTGTVELEWHTNTTTFRDTSLTPNA